MAQLEAFKSLDNRTSIPWGAVNYQKFTQSATHSEADGYMLLQTCARERGGTSQDIKNSLDTGFFAKMVDIK